MSDIRGELLDIYNQRAIFRRARQRLDGEALTK